MRNILIFTWAEDIIAKKQTRIVYEQATENSSNFLSKSLRNIEYTKSLFMRRNVCQEILKQIMFGKAYGWKL